LGKAEIQVDRLRAYQDRLGNLIMQNPTRYREFMMFSVEKKAGLADIYVGVPTEEFMALFDRFHSNLIPDSSPAAWRCYS
jgi:hypothetical protein